MLSGSWRSPTEGPLRRFIREIHRRSLWQVLGIYAVASWAVLQVVDTLGGAFRLPEWGNVLGQTQTGAA